MTAEILMETLLRHLRQQFYPDTFKAFQQQRHLLQVAITTPAAWLQSRGVSLPSRRLHDIHMDIITGIKHHAGEIRYFSGYYLHAVQQHMKIQGERYYNEGKAARNQAEKALGAIKGVTPAPADQACERLAEVNRLLQSGRPKKRAKKTTCKASAQPLPGLFGR